MTKFNYFYLQFPSTVYNLHFLVIIAYAITVIYVNQLQ